jgi:hypothetical protein
MYSNIHAKLGLWLRKMYDKLPDFVTQPSRARTLVAYGAFVLALSGIGYGTYNATHAETSTIALAPTGESHIEGMTKVDAGVFSASELWKAVDDGKSYAAADDLDSRVQMIYHQTTASHKTTYSGAPAGTVNQVVTHVRAAGRNKANASVQVLLWDGKTEVAEGPIHKLGSTWANYNDTFPGLNVSNANNLQTAVVMRHKGDIGVVGYTQVWMDATYQPSTTTVRPAAPPPENTGLIPTKAASNNAFLDAVGVNIHSSFGGAYSNSDAVASRLSEIGFRHVRDNTFPGSASQQTTLGMLKNRGIGVNFTVNQFPPVDRDRVGEFVEYYKAWLAKGLKVDSIEGPNEVDHLSADDPRWAADAKAYQTKLYGTVKHDSVLGLAGKNVPVLGPSLKANEIATTAKQLGNLRGVMDYGNYHTYPPGSNSPDRLYSGTPDIWSFLGRLSYLQEYVFPPASGQSGPTPFVTTETGYTSAYAGSPAGYENEYVQSLYMVRALLEDYRLGSVRTYVYELMDQGDKSSIINGHFGLVRADGVTLKPAGVAVKNMLGILKDTANSPGGTLEYCTCSAPSDVHQVLLRHSNGSFYLALWRTGDVPNAAQTDASKDPSEQVTVSLDKTYNLEVYKPNKGTEARALGKANKVTLPVNGEVSLLHIAL